MVISAIERNTAEKVRGEGEVVILNRVGRAGLTEKVTSARSHQCKGPEVRECLNVQEMARKQCG